MTIIWCLSYLFYYFFPQYYSTIILHENGRRTELSDATFFYKRKQQKKCIFKDQELRYSKDINTRLSPFSSSCSYQMRLVSYSTPPPIPLQFSPLLRGYSPALSRTCHDIRQKIKKKNVYPRPLEWQLSVRCLPLFFLRYSDRSRMWGG